MRLRTKRKSVTLKGILSYLKSRSNELVDLAARGDPWFFGGACTLLEVCASLRYGRAAGKKDFKDFCRDYLFPVRSEYAAATYPSTGLVLEDQLYHILRCGVVHAFSMSPDPHSSSAAFRPTPRSIMLAHSQPGLNHLARVEIVRGPESYVLIAQEFAIDVSRMIDGLFTAANKRTTNGMDLRTNILKRFREHLPLGWNTYELA